jgi:hypothetical protein
MARLDDPEIGVIAEGSEHFGTYRDLLEQTTGRDFARFHL